MKTTGLVSLIFVAVAAMYFIGVSIGQQQDRASPSRSEMLEVAKRLPIDGAAKLTDARCEYVAKSRTVLGCSYLLSASPDQLAPGLLAQGWSYVGETTSPLAFVSQREFEFRRSDLSVRLSTNETAKLITRLSIIQTR